MGVVDGDDDDMHSYNFVHRTRPIAIQTLVHFFCSFLVRASGCAEMIILAFMPISLYYHDEHDKLLLMAIPYIHGAEETNDHNNEKMAKGEK